MKHGKNDAGKAASAQESPAGCPPAMAIPFPKGISSMVVEEAAQAPHFTEREQQVGGWLAEGKSDPEIAGILTIGTESVRSYIKSMRVKVDAVNRNTLFAWIWRNRYAVQFHATAPRKSVKYT